MRRRRSPPRSPTVCDWAPVCDPRFVAGFGFSRIVSSANSLASGAASTGPDHAQRPACNAHLDWRVAHVLSVRINLDGFFRFESEALRLEILYLRNAQVP